jgi:hypothetical protein
MMLRLRSLPVAALLVLGGLGLTACNKDKAPDVDTTTATTLPAPDAPGAFSVIDIDMGRHIGADKKISDKTDDFAPSDTIYASVHTSGTANNGAITARWTFENGSVVDERTQNVTTSGDAYTAFHIVKPGGWPKGKYTVHVLIDGKEVRTKDVTVK